MHMTAYDMRISDWSSDVCSSDLQLARADVAPSFDQLRKISPVEQGRRHRRGAARRCDDGRTVEFEPAKPGEQMPPSNERHLCQRPQPRVRPRPCGPPFSQSTRPRKSTRGRGLQRDIEDKRSTWV